MQHIAPPTASAPTHQNALALASQVNTQVEIARLLGDLAGSAEPVQCPDGDLVTMIEAANPLAREIFVLALDGIAAFMQSGMAALLAAYRDGSMHPAAAARLKSEFERALHGAYTLLRM